MQDDRRNDEEGRLAALRRYEVAPFLSPQMVTVQALEDAASQDYAALDALLTPLATAFSHWRRVTVDPGQAALLSNGKQVRVTGAPETGSVAVLDEAGAMLGIAEIDAEGRVAPRRWLSDQAGEA